MTPGYPGQYREMWHWHRRNPFHVPWEERAGPSPLIDGELGSVLLRPFTVWCESNTVSDDLSTHFLNRTAMTIPQGIPEKPTEATQVRTKYHKHVPTTTLLLRYLKHDALAIREAAERIRLKGDKKPSLCLLARRSLGLYLKHIDSSPLAFHTEMEALEMLATPVSTRKVKAPQ